MADVMWKMGKIDILINYGIWGRPILRQVYMSSLNELVFQGIFEQKPLFLAAKNAELVRVFWLKFPLNQMNEYGL